MPFSDEDFYSLGISGFLSSIVWSLLSLCRNSLRPHPCNEMLFGAVCLIVCFCITGLATTAFTLLGFC